MSVPVVSLMLSIVPRTALSIVKEPPVPANTAAGFEMAPPEALHTRNFTGIVLPPLRGYTLLPSLLIGGKITLPGPIAALHTP
jgi:hypothetical protein